MALLVFCACLATGCGIRSTVHLVRAQTAIERAEERGAAQNAAYELTLAVRYLEKAREESAHARYGDAIDLAKQSEEFADQAVIVMAERGLGPEGTPEAPVPVLEPIPAPAPAEGAP